MEEKLLVNRYDEGLNVPHFKERTYKRRGYRRWCRAQVRCLAKLARGFILSVGMGVRQGLRSEQREQDRQGKSEHPDCITSHVVPAEHLDFLGYSCLFFDAEAVP